MNKYTFTNLITSHFNYCIVCGEFPDKLNIMDDISVHTKNKCGSKLQTSKFSEQLENAKPVVQTKLR